MCEAALPQQSGSFLFFDSMDAGASVRTKKNHLNMLYMERYLDIFTDAVKVG